MRMFHAITPFSHPIWRYTMKLFLANTVAAFVTLFLGVSAHGSSTYTTLDVPGAFTTEAYAHHLRHGTRRSWNQIPYQWAGVELENTKGQHSSFNLSIRPVIVRDGAQAIATIGIDRGSGHI